MRTPSCACGESEPARFYSYLPTKCKSCHYAYQKAYRARQDGPVSKDKKYTLKKRYGLTPEDYVKMLDTQADRCAICRRLPEGEGSKGVLHVDHDHQSGRVRALLCHWCNRGLGYFREDPSLFEAAAAYVRAQLVTDGDSR